MTHTENFQANAGSDTKAETRSNASNAGGTEPLKLFEDSPEATAATLEALPKEFANTRRRCETIPASALALQLAPELRPRQRLLSQSAESLSAAELLAVLLGGEAGSALGLAADVISQAGGLQGLRAASYFDLASPDETPPGGASLVEEQVCAVLAAVEFGKRITSARGPELPVISSPKDIHALLEGRLRDQDREHFVVVLLDTKNQVIGSPTVSVGTLSSSPAHPREVFKPAIQASAAGIILAHNHPSGNTEPSQGDSAVTKRLAEAGETIDIDVLDHVIVGKDGYVSLKERGLL